MDTFRFSGLHGVLGLVAVIVAFGFSAYFHSRPADDAVRAGVIERLQHDLAARRPAPARDAAPDAPTAEPVVELRSVGVHGKWGALTAIARVEYRVDGALPADGAPVRYFRIYHNRPARSWQVFGETGSWAYYSMWLP